MSPVISRLLIATGLAVVLLSGCNRDKEPAAPPAPTAPAPAVVTPAAESVPFAYESKTPFATVKLALPQGIKGQPDLHARLYAAAVRDLRQFTEGAQADRTEAGGDQGLPGYEKTITFDTAVETGKLFSLSRADFDYTGGAHGNTQYAGILWDKALKRPVEPAALFRTSANLATLDQALCAAINAARRARGIQSAPVVLGGKDWACPPAMDTPFVLVASNVAGKAGGLTFMVGPYQVGPYSEGSYVVNVPQSAIRTLFAPAYADEFAGEPVKAQDVPT